MIKGYRISTNPADMDIDAIHSFLQGSYWSAGIPRETLQTAIGNSLCFGVFYEHGQVGFARMITDSASFAYLADVYVLEAHRGKGISKWLLQTILGHPQLRGLRRMMLATRDAHELYRQFGFTALANPDTIMELWNPEVYRVG